MAAARRSTEEIRREIARAREALAQDMSALEIEMRLKLDWREQARRRPLAFVGGAFAVGFVLGLL